MGAAGPSCTLCKGCVVFCYRMYAGRHARTHSAAGTQYWQERRQTQIETGNASQILQQKAAVAYEANTDKTQQTKKFVEWNLVLAL